MPGRTEPGPYRGRSRHACAVHLGCRDAQRSSYPRDVTLLFIGKHAALGWFRSLAARLADDPMVHPHLEARFRP